MGKRTDIHLPPAAKLVLLALADRAGKDTHSCWPAKDRLAAEVGISVRAVQISLKQLVTAGLIERERRFKDGRRTSDLYTLQIPPAWLKSWEATRGANAAQIGADSSPEPEREPTSLLSKTSSYLQQGSGERTAPLDPAKSAKCVKCGCRLAKDNAFDTHCSPCQKTIANRTLVAA